MTRLFGTVASFRDADEVHATASRMASDRELEFVHPLPGCHGFVAARSGIVRTATFRDERFTCAIGGRPGHGGGEFGTLDAIAHAFTDDYRSRGTAALKSLSGSFCIALVDHREHEVLLAIDRIGIEQMAFAQFAGGIAFASSVDLVQGHPKVASTVSRQALYDYLYFHVVPSPSTIFSGTSRLEPGEYVVWRSGAIQRDRYWRMEFVEDRRQPIEDAKRAFLRTLRDAVADATSGAKAGAFLSGGTDSSTIAGMIGIVTGEPADTYSIGFEAEGYDEMEYARLAARHFRTRHHEYYVTPDDIVNAVPALAAIHDQPFGNSSAVPTYYCAKLAAQDGVTRMLGGDGGDELFGGNARYARQYLFSLYEHVPKSIRSALIQPLTTRLPAVGHPLRKLKGYVAQAAIPMPDRTESYNLLGRVGAVTVFGREGMHGIDAEHPLQMQRAEYFNPTAKSLINRQLAMDIKFTLADNDLRKVIRSCELAGLAVAFPLLDDRVVAFSLGLEPKMKLRGRTLRYFFKEALRDFLPAEVISKQKHGFGLPFGEWIVSHARLRQLAFDSLSDLRRRQMFDARFLDSLPELLGAHPRYYGTMVWILMMLEQWFVHHAPDARL
jgi:asparagine synthase (glutamine-hydrolysing)